MHRGRAVAGIFLAIGALVTGAWLVVPSRVSPFAERAREVAVSLPRPVVLAGIGLGIVIVWLVGMWLTARLVYRGWTWLWPRYKRVTGVVFPDSPLVQFAAGIMVLMVVVIVLVGTLPTLVEDTDPVTDSNATQFAEELGQQGLTGNWGQVIEGDTASATTAHRDGGVEGPDTDGDGLPDRWERAGETPSGANLSDADPDHKDLYVQVNYGENIEPLTETERRQLREIWAAMPVENPDNETGIDIHVLDNGSLGEEAVFDGSKEYDHYYTESRLGERHNVYRQVVYGRLELGTTIGRGSTPGYASIVEGRRTDDYDTTYTPRVGVTTHELLHNVAGKVDGRGHTSNGWLASGSTDEYLSTATARELTESGLYGPVD